MPPNKKKWYDKEIPEYIAYPAFCFFVLFVYTLIIANLPFFITRMYNIPRMEDQPFSELVERKIPIPITLIVCIFLGCFGLYFLYTPIDFFVATFFSLIILVNAACVSNLFMTSSAAIQNLSILLALFATHYIIYYEVFTTRWFAAVLAVWPLIFFGCLFNLDCAGILVSIICQLIVFCFYEHKRFFKLFFTIFLPMIPFAFAAVYIYKNIAPTPFRVDIPNFPDIYAEFTKNESYTLYISAAISLLAPFFLKFQTLYIPNIAGLLFGTVITILMPIQTNGDTIARTIHFAKLQLILAIGILTAGFQTSWHRYAFMALYLIMAYVSRLFYAKAEMQASPMSHIQFAD